MTKLSFAFTAEKIRALKVGGRGFDFRLRVGLGKRQRAAAVQDASRGMLMFE
jgi:hypothetical protein